MRRSSKAAFLFLLAALALGCTAEAPSADMDEPARIQQLYEGYRKAFPKVAGISALELAAQAGKQALVLVDVRTPQEQRVSMIPGALTRQDFEADRDRYRDAAIVAYCTIGARSGEFAAELAKQGFRVRNLEGGILAWTHVAGPLNGPDGPTRKVHVYGRRWNLAADGYEAVW